MDFLVNEWSLHGQYANERDFRRSFNLILSCQHEIEKHGHSCYYSRQLNTREVMPGLNLREVVKKTKDRNFIQQVANLLSQEGPFWSENRQHAEDDYFEYQNEVVTDTALAEATWRVANQQDCDTVSFKPSNFCHSPLSVIWYQSQGNRSIEVQNFWEVVTLTAFLKSNLKPPASWEELIQWCVMEYPNLTFVDDLLDFLDSEPFSEAIAKRIRELLSTLNELNTCFGEDGKLNWRGQEIVVSYFHGDKALFSDESDTNKRHFQAALTFKKPGSVKGEKIFCPFHGKIKMGREYRIHFNWPKDKPTDPLYIVYIGPKLTKH